MRRESTFSSVLWHVAQTRRGQFALQHTLSMVVSCRALSRTDDELTRCGVRYLSRSRTLAHCVCVDSAAAGMIRCGPVRV
jgi:hypothetical protein